MSSKVVFEERVWSILYYFHVVYVYMQDMLIYLVDPQMVLRLSLSPCWSLFYSLL